MTDEVRQQLADFLRDGVRIGLVADRHDGVSKALRATFTNEVIRAIGALARQQNVCREQAGKMVFVTGMDATREYIVEHVRAAIGY